jgi:aspartate/methionine/tyrosine aminotransferase
MTAPFNPLLAATVPPPVMEARRWIEGLRLPAERPLLNVSQAAPVAPPPLALRQAIAEAALNDPAAHLYGPDLGLPELRAQIAQDWSAAYGGQIAPAQVAITSGCNQAFCAAISTLARAGEAVMLPSPWYFNHKMWLDQQGIRTVVLPPDAELLPDPDRAAALLTPEVRAIVLVSPNNPTGQEYPRDLVHAFYRLAQSRGLALILDETYRDFDARPGPAHELFRDPAWPQTLIHLYSFSKAYRLTGHRIGAMLTSEARLAEVEKFIDSVTICPNQLGQRAALWGMRHLGQWLAGERAEILARRAALEAGLATLPGWRLRSIGAYFAYVEHPFRIEAEPLARRLVAEAGVLLLPGTMFAPTRAEGGDGSAERQLRIAFANVDAADIGRLVGRLAAFSG